jgi:hypothetical protein
MDESAVNWFGWDIATIAATYESNMAAKEVEEGLIDNSYMWAAFRAEQDLDPRFKDKNES